jgi:hypothetical protein
MMTRNQVTGFFLALGLLCAGTALGQEARPEVPRQKTKQAKPANLERRIDELEKLLASLVDDLKALRKGSKPAAPAPPARSHVNIYMLKNVDAAEVAEALLQLLAAEDNKRLRIATLKSANSVLVLADSVDQEMIEAIIAKLESQAPQRKNAK